MGQTSYGQLHKCVLKDTYKIAEIEGFNRFQQFQSNPAFADPKQKITFTTLVKLNNKLFPWERGEQSSMNDPACTDIMNSVETLPIMAIPQSPMLSPPQPPTVQTLTAQFIQHADKLFFFSLA